MHGVVGMEDKLLDAEISDGLSSLNPTGKDVLMVAMATARDGGMSGTVATIQTEQDQVIRADSNGIFVVQGELGTGKTAVVLHRVACLLYTQRERLLRSGVLVVSPFPMFLRYISQAPLGLDEPGIVSTAVAGLLPGVEVTGANTP